MPQSILVLGLGELGSEVVQSLARHPARKDSQIAVLLRKAKDASRRKSQEDHLRGLGAEIIFGDVESESGDQLASTFKAYQVVICCVGMYASPGVQIKIAKVALFAKVPRYFPWQFGIDYDKIGRNSGQDLFDSQLDVRDLLRGQSHTEWVIVSTGMFIPFIFEPAFGLVSAGLKEVTAIGSWENALTVTDPVDIGRVVAEIVLAHPSVKGVVHVSGDTITMADLATIVETVTTEKVSKRLETVADLEDALAQDSSNGMRKYRVVFGRGVGVAWPKETSFNSKIGMQMRTAKDWAEKNLTR